ncbi:MAG: DNA polymerase III [Candidatus Nealsonbacteria bacterium CG11_big_fil_rev_8_21_14_0_20_39_9]|uniref:DNA polymerase beta n=1 Tax=Candidatus Nealsonbacteria bacterium CG11_big_fil_rev_8_21_14_0_20_39_9 TaxID=1974715 RepID=A0A2H0MPN6_9BACT|nr:MAG: DNA polymerase III [Candidatus Nealsonbacteria bacterium CG11_big_fil_rev_8_21_14_0_20_39_9]
MKNQEIAKIFYEIANFLEMEEVQFKPYAYQKAAVALEALEENVEDIYKKGGKKALEEIPGVGKSIAEKIEEYIKTGEIKYYKDLKKKTPINMDELIRVEGMGPKRAKILYQKLNIRTLKDLEKAAKAHKIAPLFGFGEKTEKNILEGMEFLKRSKGRFLLGEILPKVKEVYEKLKNLKEIETVNPAGSIRRMKETIGDADFLVTIRKSASAKASADKIMDFFVSLPGVMKIWGKGTTKASIRVKEGFDMDIRVVPKRSYGSALQYFTGSKEHNIATRRIAMGKGLKLSEYGLFKGKKMIAGSTEEGIYKSLGMRWMPPEMRENQGEVEAALRQAQGQLPGLPKLIGYNDIKGDLHSHTVWSDGKQTIEQMALAAKAMGYKYLGVSDHSKLAIANGLDEKRLLRQTKEIDKINKKIKGIKILKGAEINILENGSLDIKNEVLAQLDYVIASVHSGFKMEKVKMTDRIIKAMKNPQVDIVAHLTGRKMGEREGCQLDLEKILRAAREYNVILEINSQPIRLDLNDQNIRRAKEAGVKMVINTDSHHKDQLRFIELGIAQARRGWAEKGDVINTQPLEKLLKYFK